MIRYRNTVSSRFTHIFHIKGSVFPQALAVAIPFSVLTSVLRWAMDEGYMNGSVLGRDGKGLMTNSAAWSGFSIALGFMSIFRTSQSYQRYQEGISSVFHMRTEWQDAASALVAFSRHSDAPDELVWKFQHIVVRLFSMLHAVAMGEIEDCSHDDINNIASFKFDILDAEGIDSKSLATLRYSDMKVELVFQWIQETIVDQISLGVLSIPPPLLTRVFQEMNAGMVELNDAVKLSSVPYPFPYTQVGDVVLLLHLFLCPIVVAQWVPSSHWAFIFTFIQLFFFWSLNFIASEVENPFGLDENDMDSEALQEEFNQCLLLCLRDSTQTVPRFVRMPGNPGDLKNPVYHNSKSLLNVWSGLADEGRAMMRKGFNGPRGANFTSVASASSGKNFEDSAGPSRGGASILHGATHKIFGQHLASGPAVDDPNLILAEHFDGWDDSSSRVIVARSFRSAEARSNRLKLRGPHHANRLGGTPSTSARSSHAAPTLFEEESHKEGFHGIADSGHHSAGGSCDVQVHSVVPLQCPNGPAMAFAQEPPGHVPHGSPAPLTT